MSRRSPKALDPPSTPLAPLGDQAKQRFVIERAKLLLVEGRSCEIFSRAFLKHVGRDDIQIRDFGNVERLRPELKTLPLIRGFERLRVCGILRDAETSAASARKSVEGAIKAADFKPRGSAPRFRVFLLPDNRSPGMLETLCWWSVEADPFIPCVESLLECAAKKGMKVGNPHKARTCAYLSIRPDYTGQVGRAAQQGHWPWDFAVFAPLKKFLVSL